MKSAHISLIPWAELLDPRHYLECAIYIALLSAMMRLQTSGVNGAVTHRKFNLQMSMMGFGSEEALC